MRGEPNRSTPAYHSRTAPISPHPLITNEAAMQHVRQFLHLPVFLLLTACQTDSATEPSTREPEASASSRPDIRTGYIQGPDGQPRKVKFEVIDGRAVLEGDITLGLAKSIPSTPDELRVRSGARLGLIVADTGKRWSHGRVRYVSPINLNNPQRVRDALAHIEASAPGITFVPISEAETSDTAYIRFEGVPTLTHCESAVGRVGGGQRIYLGENCSVPLIIHEVGHALGLQHEHMRCDRDQHVEVLWANLNPNRWDQYDTGTATCPSSVYMQFDAYNVASIMHYDEYAHTMNGYPTMRSKLGLKLGGATELARSDISALSFMYRPQTEIHRWYNPNHAGGDHLYTLNPNEGWAHGYTLEDGDYFRVTQATGQHYARLYRCLVANHHYLSRDAYCEAGVLAEGSVGRVATWQMRGTVPLHRTRNPWNGDRLATTSAAERNATLNAGWTNEGVLGYVWPGN